MGAIPVNETSPRLKSKPLGKWDESGSDFARRALGGDPTYGINFDRLQFSKTENRFIIFEYLKCDESQFARGVTPHTSHPNRYWFKGRNKFIALWKAAKKLEARLFVVNYATPGTGKENEVAVIEVLDMNECGITKFEICKTSFEQYSLWFRRMNKECE